MLWAVDISCQLCSVNRIADCCNYKTHYLNSLTQTDFQSTIEVYYSQMSSYVVVHKTSQCSKTQLLQDILEECCSTHQFFSKQCLKATFLLYKSFFPRFLTSECH